MPDGGDVGVGLAEAVGAMADDLDLVVHPLEGAVGDPQPRPSHDAEDVLADHARELFEGLEAAVRGPPEPLLQVGKGPAFVAVIPEALERLLQVVGADDRLIDPAQGGEPAPLLPTEAPGIPQPEPAGLLRSEERRVGKECRARWSTNELKK